MNKYKNTVIAIMLGCILTMSISYALLSQKLNINGTANIGSVWSIKITDIESNATGEAKNKIAPSHTDTTATFNADLVNPGDKMEYVITLSNLGTLSAIIKSVTLDTEENDAIKYTIQDISDNLILNKNHSLQFKVIVEYNSNVTTQPKNVNTTATLNINVMQNINGENNDEVAVSNIVLSRTTATIKAGSTLTLKTTISPTNATNKIVTWKSSNTKIAKVSSTGVVTAIAKGTAKITATTSNEKTATCTVTVN